MHTTHFFPCVFNWNPKVKGVQKCHISKCHPALERSEFKLGMNLIIQYYFNHMDIYKSSN